ncbi:MAG TPA: hypothetical protein DHM37_07020 [Candidatus Cloacimonas sp.]|nr:hypothetical protein [Candidatus Cloacimonas sp.]
MRLFKSKFLVMLILLSLLGVFLEARSVDGEGAFKKRDHSKVHRIGNIWLRVSNYGFFGSGDNSPQWPSLEYPGGSAIDYLYQGALWFGAKKYRRDQFNRRLFWLPDASNKDDVVAEGSNMYDSLLTAGFDLEVVLDTLTTVGFDGDLNLYEFLPAYNVLETSPLGLQYSQYNNQDVIMGASIRNQRRGVDDDGDGLIDEDPVGYGFPMRLADELPEVFQEYGSSAGSPAFLHQAEGAYGIDPILNNIDIWFPLGFVDLSDTSNELYNFAEPHDDDVDGLADEDGYPVSEQDYVSFYYDYSPFGTPGQRSFGSSASSNDHVPLNVRVRQMSYQWSYDYIKNLVYVEFDITNMNIAPQDTLFDCAMGIYMDSDVGPQAWGATDRASDDISSYVLSHEFAYTYDAEQDGGLTTGYVGSRVCTPDPEQLEFACWTWKVGDGPDDFDPLDTFNPPAGSPTANQKYWLLTDKNPDDSKYTSLRDFPNTQISNPVDTRYLFAFYGDQQGFDEPTEGSWNLEPGKTMKIVIAVFPGQTLTELQGQAEWAAEVYESPQTLTTVTVPDTAIHYVAPEPPKIPNMNAILVNNGNAIDVFWDNRSEIDNLDTKTVTKGYVGWQDSLATLDSHISNYDPNTFPDDFAPPADPSEYNNSAIVNPWTAYRLRHDFQGYTVWGRSGSGSQEDWMEIGRWDKIDTDQDYEDYNVNEGAEQYVYFGGDTGKDLGLPQPVVLDSTNPEHQEYFNYYRFNEMYELVHYEDGDIFYGKPLYNYELTYTDSLQDYVDALYPSPKTEIELEEEAWLFASDALKAMGERGREIYLSLYDDKLIPLKEHGGQSYGYNYEGAGEAEDNVKDRLARRYYKAQIMHPPKGIEYYLAVTSWDRGIPNKDLQSLESGRDEDANMQIVFPGPSAKSSMNDVHVVPNPYVGQSKFDGRRENDEKGDKSRRLWFVNVPEKCKIRIFTLAGDLVDTIHHDGAETTDIISVSKAADIGVSASGIAPWDLLSRNNQIIAPGVYLFSVENLDGGDIKVGKFVIIK